MEELLDVFYSYLKEKRSIDFTLYRQDTVLHGIRFRLNALGFEDYSCYLDYLPEHYEEIDVLLRWLVINVSEFSRGSLTFAVLGEIVLPELCKQYTGKQIRVWSIGYGEGGRAIFGSYSSKGVDAGKHDFGAIDCCY
ncbi:MAG: hypothetical protein ABDK92_00050 [Atribacterota bacterium]